LALAVGGPVLPRLALISASPVWSSLLVTNACNTGSIHNSIAATGFLFIIMATRANSTDTVLEEVPDIALSARAFRVDGPAVIPSDQFNQIALWQSDHANYTLLVAEVM
jgi:hypothetical protein